MTADGSVGRRGESDGVSVHAETSISTAKVATTTLSIE